MTGKAREEALIGGVERREIVIVDYDTMWVDRFKQHAKNVRRALGNQVLALEHVGSTSVPGLAAKPIVDIDLIVEDSSNEDAYLPALEAAGYELRVREPDWHEHRMMRTPTLDVHVHVFSSGSTEFRKHILFRDWLREHADDRRDYESIKRNLSVRSWEDMNAYAQAKSSIIDRILASAIQDGL